MRDVLALPVLAWSVDYDGCGDVVRYGKEGRKDDLHATLAHASAGRRPDTVMSGSARVLWHTNEDHVAHLAAGFEGYPFDRTAQRAGHAEGTLRYDTRIPACRDHTAAKLDLVRTQLAHVHARFPGRPVRFVFADDIYARRLASLLQRTPAALPLAGGDSLVLVQYKSHVPRTCYPRCLLPVVKGVEYSPHCAENQPPV